MTNWSEAGDRDVMQTGRDLFVVTEDGTRSEMEGVRENHACSRRSGVVTHRPLTTHQEEGTVTRSRTPFPVLPSYAYKPRRQKSPSTAIHSRPETGPTASVRASRTVWYVVKYQETFSKAVVAMLVQKRGPRYDRPNER